MTFYTIDRIPEWRNNLFIGSLSGQHIVRLVIENNRVTGEERLLASERQVQRYNTRDRWRLVCNYRCWKTIPDRQAITMFGLMLLG